MCQDSTRAHRVLAHRCVPCRKILEEIVPPRGWLRIHSTDGCTPTAYNPRHAQLRKSLSNPTGRQCCSRDLRHAHLYQPQPQQYQFGPAFFALSSISLGFKNTKQSLAAPQCGSPLRRRASEGPRVSAFCRRAELNAPTGPASAEISLAGFRVARLRCAARLRVAGAAPPQPHQLPSVARQPTLQSRSFRRPLDPAPYTLRSPSSTKLCVPGP